MSQRIDWTSGMKVPGGPELAVSRSVQVEAFGLIEVAIPKNGSASTDVDVPPATQGEVKFLAILSDIYEDLTYTVNALTTDVTLDQPDWQAALRAKLAEGEKAG